ncbi:MAG TPA: short-chain dehydrogenase/reductase [Alphaproteobacteria bacterium]|nr:short-chain dehydrogenase/reductase [Alphaproteobacteria bacterium]
MDLELTGKRALITGASRGIGRATARLLAEEGCDLVLVARGEEGLAATAEEIAGKAGVSVATVAADLSSAEGIASVVMKAGDLDILVNNAGAIPPGSLQDIPDDTWRAAWDLKVFGYVNLTRALYPALKQRAGVVVNISGAGGEKLSPDYIVGGSGNASLMAFTRSLAKAAHKDGMRVLAINPGPVMTDRVETMLKAQAVRDFGDESRWPEFFATMPFGRAAAPEEIANAVAFLASPRSAYTSGTILTIDGGAQ